MIKNALENLLHQLETLELLIQSKSDSDYSSSNFIVRSFREDEILNGRKNYKSWKRMIINDLDALELSKCIISEDGDDNRTKQHRKKMKARTMMYLNASVNKIIRHAISLATSPFEAIKIIDTLR